MNRLKTEIDGIELYFAGIPKFGRIFTRDSIISALICKDINLLKGQLIFSSLRQGKKINSYTGEELGKIFHEFPGYTKRELLTEFNGCDTTALYIIGHYEYLKLTKDKSLIEKYEENIKKAVEYIINHIDSDGFFIEDPKFVDNDKFGLKITYWKDSTIIGRETGEPIYPVVYTLAHIKNLAALRFAAQILKTDEFNSKINLMRNKLEDLFDYDKKCFYLAKDKKGKISGISSDSLHALYYLEESDIDKEKIDMICESSQKLETEIGYRTLDPESSTTTIRTYHTDTVWPFEQAIIHLGAKKFNLKEVKKNTEKIIKFLDTDPEIFIIKEGEYVKGGCDPQLWTIAAKKYFNQELKKII